MIMWTKKIFALEGPYTISLFHISFIIFREKKSFICYSVKYFKYLTTKPLYIIN